MNELLRTALHEASHCVTAWALAVEVDSVTIIPDATSVGRCRYRGPCCTHPYAGALISIAGEVGEHLLSTMREPDWTGGGRSDRRAIDRRLVELSDDHKEHVVWQLGRWASEIIARHSITVRELAAALVEHGLLEARQMEHWRLPCWDTAWDVIPWAGDILGGLEEGVWQRATAAWSQRPARATR